MTLLVAMLDHSSNWWLHYRHSYLKIQHKYKGFTNLNNDNHCQLIQTRQRQCQLISIPNGLVQQKVYPGIKNKAPEAVECIVELIHIIGFCSPYNCWSILASLRLLEQTNRTTLHRNLHIILLLTSFFKSWQP